MTNEKKAPAQKPNLVIVLVDQMRYMAMGCAGNTQIRTPHLDRFANEGASLDCAISNIPVCTPARACLLTGRYPLSTLTIRNCYEKQENIKNGHANKIPKSKFQIPRKCNQIKAKGKTERKTGFILFLLEFDYSLEFGFWNLEFLGLRA